MKARAKEEYVYNFTTNLWGYRNNYTYDDADNLTQVARSLNNGTRTQQFSLVVKDDDGEIGISTVTITTTYTATDTDGDGIHDAYETEHGMNPNSADANLDYDGDGISNKNEYLNGTNPQSDEIHDHDTPFLPPWALMLLGSGLAGVVLKRQRKQTELRA